jgi:hypothetical protein
MTTTAPYTPAVEQLVATTHAQDVTLTLAAPGHPDVTLDLEAGSLSFDTTRAPRVDLSATVRTPGTQTDLDLYDPRSGARLKLDAGYIFPSGRLDSAPVADLLLTYRNSSRPGDTLDIRATSSEQRVIERGLDAVVSGAAGVAAGTAIQTFILDRYPEAVVVVDDAGPAVAAAWTADPGQDPWDTVKALADPAGLQVFDDGLGTIHIAEQARLEDPAHWRLFVGESGTVEGSDSDIDRVQFSNGVVLVHTWTPPAGAETRVVGRAFAADGPHIWGGPAGRCLFVENRSTETTQTAADYAAAQMLYRRLGAGRGVSVSAVAAWWLRPGMTVDMLFPLGDTMRQLVSAVSFDLTAARMSVTTREAEDFTTSTTPPGG